MPTKRRLAPEDWPKIAKDHGHYDMRIARDGTWFHEGRPIQRPELVKLFASVLRCGPDGQHWLVTPVEKGRIDVEDAAFVATLTTVSAQGSPEQSIVLTTNIDDRLSLGPDHALVVEMQEASGEPRPYVTLERGLHARLTASAFYDLVELGEERDGHLWLLSQGCWFDLGALE